MWRTKYTKEVHQKVDDRLLVEENSQGEAEVPRRAEENAQMRVEEHSQGTRRHPAVRKKLKYCPQRMITVQKMLASRQRRTVSLGKRRTIDLRKRTIDLQKRRTVDLWTEENYQSMDEGNRRPVEEENHQPTEEENHSVYRRGESIQQTRMLPLVDDENDHNDDSADKAADELAKMAVDDHALAHPQVTSQGSPGFATHTPEYSPITPEILTLPPDHHPIIDLLLRLMSFLLGRLQRIYLCEAQSHTLPSPSAPYSHQVSHKERRLEQCLNGVWLG
ncbi:hypothetical protein BS47DRAFT_1394381 [Hydnum rufescens UP504]|uniref:Uncharacterized protein n=1 Tax=Hydnum rufescens UP504 TaxID=1448309 RepID=A0A9P6AV14_9AGAM|nr:hypothetical protein BS47DRAFT_1394381 [Hydnum rufescens UP504]